MYGCGMADKETIRQNVRDAFERFMTRGEADLVRDDLGLAMQAGLLPTRPGDDA